MSTSRNTVVIFIGAIAPLGIFFVTVPIYLSLIGVDRYGIVLLISIVLDYFGVFGIGLDASTTNQLARSRNDETAREEIFWTALVVNGLLGSLGGLLVYFVGNFLLSGFINISIEHQAEIIASMPWIAVATPIITVTAVLIGSLQACEQFLKLTILQFLGTIFLQFAPLAIAYWYGPNLVFLIAAAVLSRLVTGGLMMVAVARTLKLGHRILFSSRRVKSLVQFGSWVAVTGLISPILGYLDRFLIGWMLGAHSVTYYTVPWNVVTKAAMLPASLVRALFPRFSIYDREHALNVSYEAIMSLAVILAPVFIVGMFAFALFLRFWLGEEFAEHAHGVAECLIPGLWVNCMAFIPFAFLQAQGRPDLVAKLHFLELVPFVLVLWAALLLGGIRGAAIAWSIRVAVDALLLFYLSGQLRAIALYLAFPTALILTTATITNVMRQDSGWYLVLGLLVIISVCVWAVVCMPRPLRDLVTHMRDFKLLLKSGNKRNF